jgi:hypothetical protein
MLNFFPQGSLEKVTRFSAVFEFETTMKASDNIVFLEFRIKFLKQVAKTQHSALTCWIKKYNCQAHKDLLYKISLFNNHINATTFPKLKSSARLENHLGQSSCPLHLRGRSHSSRQSSPSFL